MPAYFTCPAASAIEFKYTAVNVPGCPRQTGATPVLKVLNAVPYVKTADPPWQISSITIIYIFIQP